MMIALHANIDGGVIWAWIAYAILFGVGLLIWLMIKSVHKKFFINVPKEIGERRRKNARKFFLIFCCSLLAIGCVVTSYFAANWKKIKMERWADEIALSRANLEIQIEQERIREAEEHKREMEKQQHRIEWKHLKWYCRSVPKIRLLETMRKVA